MPRAGYTGHHINSVELGSLGQNGKATHEILYIRLFALRCSRKGVLFSR